MGDTFGNGTHHRPGKTSRQCRDHQRGHSKQQVQRRASYDHEPQMGCGAIFLLCILAIAAALGIALT